MQLKAFAVILIATVAGLFAYNVFVAPVPGLEWARLSDGDAANSAGGEGKTAEPRRRGNGASGGGSGRGFDGPAPVTVAAAAISDVPVYLRGVGTARALATVTVRPQVDGRLIKVHFKEGQDVKRGDLLAEIDPVTYRAQLDQAIAKRKLTEVQLSNAETDLKRLTSVAAGVVSQKSVDTQRAQVAQFEAQLKSDEAAIANAQAVLDYTRIVSPLDGRTGQRLVDEGNLIRAGDAGIVTIAQLQPLSVQFTIPQQQLTDVKAAMARGPVPVEALAADDRTVIETGSLSFIDNQVDQTTGTVKMKADMPNARLQLWPGQFANVRVRLDIRKNAVTVPTASVQRGPSNAFVYVVTEAKDGQSEATVQLRNVVVTQQTEAKSVIAQGLAAGERVVTTGFGRLKDGVKVAVAASPAPAGTEVPADQSPTSGAAGTPNAATSPAASASPEPATRDGRASSDQSRAERRRRAEGEGRRERPVVQ